MKKPVIQLSQLDKQAPPDVQVMIRLTGEPTRAHTPPPSLGDYYTIEEAQARSDELTKQKVYHGALTWWRRNGRRVNKWATMLSGKRRYFKVSVPYVQGITDDMIKVLLRRAVLSYLERPPEYTEESLQISVDAESNRIELGGVAVRLPPELAERARLLGQEEFNKLVAQALENSDA